MRTLVLFAALLGATEMATKTQAQEKKGQEPAEFKAADRVFNERVTVKEWDAQQKKFLKPHEGVWALRKDVKDKGLMIVVYGKTKPGRDLEKNPGVFFVDPRPGSVITDAAGNEYLVESTEGSTPTVCWVKLTKPAPRAKKKP